MTSANVFSSAKAAWHIDKIVQLRAGEDIIPTHVQLIISDYCNHACHFCGYRRDTGFSSENFADAFGNRNPMRFIPTTKALQILDDCAALGVKAIEFTGGGEPTVHANHLEIFAHAQRLGLETGLVTNGVALRDRPAFRDLDWLRVSVDAGRRETYEQIRQSRDWDRVLRNLELAASFGKPLVGAGFVITRENCRELVQACRLVKATGAAYLRVSAMFSTEGAAYYDGLLSEIADERRKAAALQDDSFKVIDFFDNRIEDLNQGSPESKFCGEQQFVLYIGGDQKVYRCCTTAYTKHGEIGDLRTQRFRDWITSYRRYDFDARSCHHCQFHNMLKVVEFLIDPDPIHVNFV